MIIIVIIVKSNQLIVFFLFSQLTLVSEAQLKRDFRRGDKIGSKNNVVYWVLGGCNNRYKKMDTTR